MSGESSNEKIDERFIVENNNKSLKVMAVFYLISILSILIVFIVPCIIGTRYMIKKQIAWHIQILWLLLIVLTSYGGLVVCMLYNKDV